MNQKTFTQEEKDKWISIGKEHQKHDRFVQGGWLSDEDKFGVFKGCFFGCFMQSDDNVISNASKTMNLPEWLVAVSERIFEGLPPNESLLFPVKLLEAIPVNSDLTEVWKNWNYTILMDDNYGQYNFCGDNVACIDAVKKVAQLFKSPVISESAARSAWLAARSAWLAAESAWLAAESEESAESAESAARSAESAARSAELAARSARSAHYIWMKGVLIDLLKSAKE